jgi:hypothetical protein
MPIQRTGNIVTIPILNDLIFTLLYNSTSEQRRGLQNYYLKQIESQAKLRNFCTTSSREEKEEILSHFGFRFFYVVMHKDISYYLNLYAKSVHHPNYFLNFQILRTGYHIHNWGRNNVNTENMEVREMIESETLVMRTLLSANVMMHMFSGATGLTMPHIHILMYLYIKRHIYVPRAALVSFFKGFGPYNKARYVLVCMQELWTEKYVERGLDKKSYTITARGVKKISEFRDQVLTFNQMF